MLRVAALAAVLVGLGQEAALAQTPAAPLSLDLICTGGGSAKRSVTFGSSQSSSDDYAISGRIDFEGTARVRIRDSGGQIMLPPEMSGDGNPGGWKDIKRMKVTEDAIEGKAGISIVYAPQLRIDRLTGQLTVAGSYNSFTGTCSAAPTPAERKF